MTNSGTALTRTAAGEEKKFLLAYARPVIKKGNWITLISGRAVSEKKSINIALYNHDTGQFTFLSDELVDYSIMKILY